MTDFYKDQADELKVQNKALAESVDELKDKLAQSNVTKLEDEIKKLTAQTKDMSDVIKEKSDTLTAKETELAEAKKKGDELSKANDDLVKANTELTEKVSAVEAEKKTVARVSTLVDGGFTKEDADKKVASFAKLDDEQFDIVAKELIAAKKNIDKNPENPGDAKADDLDDAEVTDTDVTSAGVTDGDFDISELAGKLSAELKTKDGDK